VGGEGGRGGAREEEGSLEQVGKKVEEEVGKGGSLEQKIEEGGSLEQKSEKGGSGAKKRERRQRRGRRQFGAKN
jgi:hypothetical protein